MSPPKVAVIGAGIAGIIALKESLESGFDAVCFEALDHIGGQWRYTELDPKTGEAVSSIYRSVIINTSRDTMCMSDFPMDPAEYAIYMHNTEVDRYMSSYADFFNINSRINLNTRVLSVTEDVSSTPDSPKWRVKTMYLPTENPVEKVEIFDAVFMCTGHHSRPNIPAWEGVEKFSGKFIHSHYYRDVTEYIGKKVAVVGMGNSGVDISSELSTVTKKTHLISRTGAWVFPRFMFGEPYENLFTRFAIQVLPRTIGQWISERLVVLSNGQSPPELKPKHRITQAHPTTRSDIIERVRMGTITPHRGSIERFTEKGIVLTDGQELELEVDAVIACTGYKVEFPYLDRSYWRSEEDDGNWTHLYKMVTPPEWKGLFFIGNVQPLGALMPVCEMQARWATSMLAGDIPRPEKEEMEAWIKDYKDAARKRWVASPRHTIQVDFLPYCDMLANDLGATPSFANILSNYGLFSLKGWGIVRHVFFGPPTPIQYRLFGRGAKRRLAELGLGRIFGGAPPMGEEEKALFTGGGEDGRC
ncbi:hypothetical protein RUND412_006245 [Rhizina undulata]